MSSIATTSIRHTLRSYTTPLRLQRRWARVHDVRFVATHQGKQQIHDRYKEKLKQKAQEEGHETVDSLKEAYKDKIAEQRRKASTLGPAIPIPDGDQPTTKTNISSPTSGGLQQTPPPAPQPQTSAASQKSSSSSSSSSETGIRPLSSFVQLDKLSALTLKDLTTVWRLCFASEALSLTAVIPLEVYNRIYSNARKHPQFILPLPRPTAEDTNEVKHNSSGFGADEARSAADIHFMQWGFHPPAGVADGQMSAGSKNTHTSTVLFTHLAAFKLHGTYAQPHTTVTHYLDLADSHGVVLLHGSVTDGRGVSPDEARWLLMCLQKFYDFEGHGGGVGRERRQGLLEKFSKGDTEGFSVEALIDEAERIS